MPDTEKHEPDFSEKPMSELERSASVNTVDNMNGGSQVNAQASGDRAIVLMDLENGLVGWESADDPENPQ